MPPALALLFVAALAPAAPVPKAKAPDVFPTSLGTKWEKRGPGDEKDVIVEEVTSAVEKDGVQTVRVDIKLPNGRSTFNEYELKDGEVRVLAFSGAKRDPPSLLYKTGAKSGDTWTNECKVRGVLHKWTVEVGKAEEVTTPAGKFTATPLTLTFEEPKPIANGTHWYVEGVGVVRYANSGEDKPSEELKSFTPGKK